MKIDFHKYQYRFTYMKTYIHDTCNKHFSCISYTKFHTWKHVHTTYIADSLINVLVFYITIRIQYGQSTKLCKETTIQFCIIWF